MKSQIVRVLLVSLLLIGSGKTQEPLTEEQAIAEIEKLGGTVRTSHDRLVLRLSNVNSSSSPRLVKCIRVASETEVAPRISFRSRVSPAKWRTPASVIWVPARFRIWRFASPLRCSRAASVILVVLKLSCSRLASALRRAHASSVTWQPSSSKDNTSPFLSSFERPPSRLKTFTTSLWFPASGRETHRSNLLPDGCFILPRPRQRHHRQRRA